MVHLGAAPPAPSAWCHLGRKDANWAAHAGAAGTAVAEWDLVQVLLVVVLGGL